MAFAGNFGAANNLIPFALIRNVAGEPASGYDADGNIKFLRASGSEYTPERVDTLIIDGLSTEASAPLSAVAGGLASVANADTGGLTTSAPAADYHSLPANFGPGRGNWSDGPNAKDRLRVTPLPDVNADVEGLVTAQGSVSVVGGNIIAVGNRSVNVRSFFGADVDILTLIVECIHSIQG